MSRSRHCAWRDNGSAPRTVSCCITRGYFVSNDPCHRTCKPSNEHQGSEECRGLRTRETAQQLEVKRRTVSAGPPTVCDGAILESRLEVAACTECHSQRRPPA